METIEMSKEEVQKVLDEIEWSEVHYLTVFEDYGSTIHVKTDGTFFVLGSGTYLRDYSEIIGTIEVVGYGNIDHWDYLDGWGTWDRENDAFLTDDGRTLTTKEAIEECIEVGEWQIYIDEWKQFLLEQWQRDIENKEESKRLKEDLEIWRKENLLLLP